VVERALDVRESLLVGVAVEDCVCLDDPLQMLRNSERVELSVHVLLDLLDALLFLALLFLLALGVLEGLPFLTGEVLLAFVGIWLVVELDAEFLGRLAAGVLVVGVQQRLHQVVLAA
jgi:hypothetical protein